MWLQYSTFIMSFRPTAHRQITQSRSTWLLLLLFIRLLEEASYYPNTCLHSTVGKYVSISWAVRVFSEGRTREVLLTADWRGWIICDEFLMRLTMQTATMISPMKRMAPRAARTISRMLDEESTEYQTLMLV